MKLSKIFDLKKSVEIAKLVETVREEVKAVREVSRRETTEGNVLTLEIVV